MESKAVVYAVLAVALGYLLISAVPDRLAALQGATRREGAKEMESLGVEEPAVSSSKTVPEGSISDLGEDVTADVVEPESVGVGGVWDGAVALGVWVINLMIALGVYFIVRRRLS